MLRGAERGHTFRRAAEFRRFIVGVEFGEFRTAPATLGRPPCIGGPPAAIVESRLGAGLVCRGGRDQLVIILLIAKRVTDGRLSNVRLVLSRTHIDHIFVVWIEQRSMLRADSPPRALIQDKVFLRFILVWADRVKPRRRLSFDLASQVWRRMSWLRELETAFDVVSAGADGIDDLALRVSLGLDAVSFEHLRLGHGPGRSLEFRRITSC